MKFHFGIDAISILNTMIIFKTLYHSIVITIMNINASEFVFNLIFKTAAFAQYNKGKH